MSDIKAEVVEIVFKQRGLKIEDFDCLVYTDSEYNQLPYDIEEKLDNEYEAIAFHGFVLYIKEKVS